MPLLFQYRVYRRDLHHNRDVLYVFGDNELRRGMGGQAGEMRGEINAVGVCTLAAPGRPWSDESAARQCGVVDGDMAQLFEALRQGRIVVWPSEGIGTGLAGLEKASPTTFAHINKQLEELKRTVPDPAE